MVREGSGGTVSVGKWEMRGGCVRAMFVWKLSSLGCDFMMRRTGRVERKISLL